MAKYETNFIPQNKAPKNNDYIYVYNGTQRIGKVKTSGLNMPALGNKLYSFGALSDVHVQLTTAQAKFQKALAYLNSEENVVFTCIAGDLTDNGETSDFETYRDYVEAYSPNTPIYAVTGNHDVQTSLATYNSLQQYLGNPLYYTFTQGDDIFIMFGMQSWYSYIGEPIFSDEALQWLYEQLETNRNKRCFVFEHCPRSDGCGWVPDTMPDPTGDLLHTNDSRPLLFRKLMEHYKNVIWFHGHSHMVLDNQKNYVPANYDRLYGCHSVHIPSLATGRYLNAAGDGYTNTDADSEGYVVDVYENHIILRGRDFVEEKFNPIATYCLDTKLQTIEANTFTDSTGTIVT